MLGSAKGIQIDNLHGGLQVHMSLLKQDYGDDRDGDGREVGSKKGLRCRLALCRSDVTRYLTRRSRDTAFGDADHRSTDSGL